MTDAPPTFELERAKVRRAVRRSADGRIRVKGRDLIALLDLAELACATVADQRREIARLRAELKALASRRSPLELALKRATRRDRCAQEVA